MHDAHTSILLPRAHVHSLVKKVIALSVVNNVKLKQNILTFNSDMYKASSVTAPHTHCQLAGLAVPSVYNANNVILQYLCT